MRQEESRIQRRCVTWFRLQYPEYAKLLFAVPNGGERTSRIAGARLKAEGVMAGVADLLLLVSNGIFHGLAIEMKTEKGRQAKTQKEWEKLVKEQGYEYIICRSVEEFVEKIKEYLPKEIFL